MGGGQCQRGIQQCSNVAADTSQLPGLVTKRIQLSVKNSQNSVFMFCHVKASSDKAKLIDVIFQKINYLY